MNVLLLIRYCSEEIDMYVAFDAEKWNTQNRELHFYILNTFSDFVCVSFNLKKI